VESLSLRHLKLRAGEAHRETLQVPLEAFVLGGQTYSPSIGTLPVALEIQRATSGDVFRIAFSTTLAGPCVRCLDPARTIVDATAVEYEEAGADAPAELRSDYVVDGELRVGQWVRDQVALLLPEQIVCRPDCAGLCPTCGKNLNEEPHLHEQTELDPRWAALEALRERDA
jgi:uncharacterized protein